MVTSGKQMIKTKRLRTKASFMPRKSVLVDHQFQNLAALMKKVLFMAKFP